TSEKIPSDQVIMMDEKIIAAVMTNGDVINFDENGGYYHLLKSVIVGTSVENEEIIIPLANILEFRKSKVPAVGLDEIGANKITEVVAYKNRLFKFNKEGGNYNKQDNAITGTAKDGTTMSVKLEYILEIHLDLPETFSKQKIIENEDLFVSQIVLQNSNRIITLNDDGAQYFQQKAVVSGVTKERETVYISVSEILYVKVERTDAAATVLATLGVVVGILAALSLIALATKQSCPFVYSFDSEKYVFDAEPLGGAVTRGLQRTDLSKLDYLKEDNDKYKLLVRNEVPETQYLDKMSLVIADHPKDTEIITDLSGNLHTIEDPQKPILAKDENGNDLTNFIQENDYTFWQTKLPVEDYESVSNLKHELTFVFPKPRDKKKAKLVINAGTSLWGSQMIREMLSLYGDDIDTWYEKVDNMGGTEIEKEQMMQFVVREQLYYLNIMVQERDSWKSHGLIFGGGPLIAETKTYDLDLSNVQGDSLVIQLTPPYGFWTLDYISIEYDEHPAPLLNEVYLTNASDYNNEDIIKTLSSKNDDYHAMPQVGDYFLAEFDALPEAEGLNRTIFLKTTGYYELHLPKDQPMQKQTLYDIVNIPGEVVKYAMRLYESWSLTLN
ncbi:MAG: hypothetical protein DRQ01_00775, partial [Ignavibacteriae bacterium]